jgi:hypothetical protein
LLGDVYSSTCRRDTAAVVAADAEAREERIVTTEVTAQQAAETNRTAVTAVEAATAAATALRDEDVDDRERAQPRSPHGHRRVSPSPVLRRGRHHRRGSPLPVIQRVIKEFGGSMPWLMHTKTNYNDWSLLMKVRLRARQLWDAVEFSDVEFHEGWLALDTLLASVPPEMVSSLADKPTAKDAWDSIAASHIDIDRVRKATVQKLR